LRLALEMIGKCGLATDPLNYCLWYEYVSGRNEPLNAAVDRHLQSSSAFSEEISRLLYHQHLTNDKGTTLILGELKRVFAEIIGAIKTTDQHFSQADNNLEGIHDSLVPNLSDADVKMIVDQIKHEIKELESTTGFFKDQLQQATHEVEQLKNKMARYRDEAIKDPLTRIDNRRGFDKKMNEAIAKANAEGTTLCLIMADIDHFKKVNDTHGHLVGDNVLRMVASTITSTIKGKDLAARIGGEEFAILLPDTPFDGAIQLAENMRFSFDRLDLKKKNTGESLGKITLSFGVATYIKNEIAEDFVNRADEALYQSKRTGRNKVTGL